ncbi:hypothetical protein [Thiomicrorhabdus lithotrophica]|uniref:PBP domain-containing protein n=1 Tax=Thiomicrorhabdus lithotrophica TaxID=2949997 RepID=A0ABY8C6N9_9GAMM|nr:hypothetical protein [Thiomicrorhabdus lithotrophica]WEJ61630.1 hypothetical protein NR989_06325 [Thiomicrorhabdus lithotrophica]
MKRLLYQFNIIILFTIPSQLPAENSTNIEQKIVLIANTTVDSISTRELKLIYSTKLKKWPNGKAIQVFNLAPKSETFRQFCLQNLRLQPYQLERIWKRMMFTGTGTPPTTVGSIDEMKNKIINTPGAIGYLPYNIEILPQYKLEVIN